MKLTWTTKRIKLKDLQEWEKNPVQISERDAKELARSIGKFDHVIPYVAAAAGPWKSARRMWPSHSNACRRRSPASISRE